MMSGVSEGGEVFVWFGCSSMGKCVGEDCLFCLYRRIKMREKWTCLLYLGAMTHRPQTQGSYAR